MGKLSTPPQVKVETDEMIWQIEEVLHNQSIGNLRLTAHRLPAQWEFENADDALILYLKSTAGMLPRIVVKINEELTISAAFHGWFTSEAEVFNEIDVRRMPLGDILRAVEKFQICEGIELKNATTFNEATMAKHEKTSYNFASCTPVLSGPSKPELIAIRSKACEIFLPAGKICTRCTAIQQQIQGELSSCEEATGEMERHTVRELSEPIDALPANRKVMPSRKRLLVEESSSGTDDDDGRPISCYASVWRSSNYAEKSGRDATIADLNHHILEMSVQLQVMNHKIVDTQLDMNRMLESVKIIERSLEAIVPHFTTSIPSELPSVFPIPDGKKLGNLDQLVASDPGVFDQMVKTLASIGGDNSDDFMKRVMPRLLKNEFANRCSVFGRNDKYCLKTTVIFKSVFAAVKMNLATKDCTEKDVERAMRKWITNSRDRAGGSRHRKFQDFHDE